MMSSPRQTSGCSQVIGPSINTAIVYTAQLVSFNPLIGWSFDGENFDRLSSYCKHGASSRASAQCWTALEGTVARRLKAQVCPTKGGSTHSTSQPFRTKRHGPGRGMPAGDALRAAPWPPPPRPLDRQEFAGSIKSRETFSYRCHP